MKPSIIRKEKLYYTGDISLEEKSLARSKWLLNEQRLISDNQMNQLKISGAYKDIDGLVKLKGRLGYSGLNECSERIVNTHSKVLRAGMKDTLNEVRSEYWLIQGRSQVRTVLKKCYLCRKYGAKLLEKLPAAPLPDFRAQCCNPFTFCGTDYLGPIFAYPTPSSKADASQKVHVVLFTCANTRAIHLHIVPDISCEAFINCLRWFFSRQGIPKLVISDKAKCFTGAQSKKFIESHDIE